MDHDYSGMTNISLLRSVEAKLKDTKELRKEVGRLRDDLRPGFDAQRARQL